MSIRATRSTAALAALALAFTACVGTDSGNPLDSPNPLGPFGGSGRGSTTDPMMGTDGGFTSTRPSGDPESSEGAGVQRRCADGVVPALPDAAACGGDCNGGWFCCTALDDGPACVHETHPCFRLQLCGEGDAGMPKDASTDEDAG